MTLYFDLQFQDSTFQINSKPSKDIHDLKYSNNHKLSLEENSEISELQVFPVFLVNQNV